MIQDAPNWVFTLFSFIGFILCAIPLPWHLEAWNVGTCLFMIWTGLACLNQSINSIIWNSDVINRAPVWCDISSQLILAVSVGIPASSLCINRRLYHIASVQSVTKTRAQKRRDIMIDLAIGLGIPLLELVLHPIVQSHRFAIYEEIGCYPFTFNTPASYVIYLTWPVIIGLVSASYAIRTIREFIIRRVQFKQYLSINKHLSSSWYFRLMALASMEIVLAVPVGCLNLYFNLNESEVQPYVSWDNAHANFSEIILYPAALWKSVPAVAGAFELSRWIVVICALLFFGFFGFADEARKNYRLAYASVAKRVGISTRSMSTTGTWSANASNPDPDSSATMPVYVTQQTEKQLDSLVSYSSRLTLPDVGGALADMKMEPQSPTTTLSTSMSRESFSRSPIDLDSLPLPTLPEATLDTSSPPRYTPDVPHAV